MRSFLFVTCLVLSFLKPEVGFSQGKNHYYCRKTFESLAVFREVPGDSAQMVWQFNYQPGMPTFFHPVYTPDGTLLTAEAPKDHPWHLGLWFCWKYINGLNYWEFSGDSKTRVSEGMTDQKRITIRTRYNGSARIRLDITYHPWYHPDSVALLEVRKISISAPAGDGSYFIDFEHFFTAVNDVVLDRTPPQTNARGIRWGGYAGLSVRFDQKLSDPSFFSPELDSMLSGKQAPWVAANLKTESGNLVQMIICDHPDNPRSPVSWYCINRPNDRFWYYNAAILYHEPIKLQAGQKMTLKYRVLVPAKPLTRAEIEGKRAERKVLGISRKSRKEPN